jgi:exopolysaccharide biosynthesis polyprenyl glycosylphosphotransferase
MSAGFNQEALKGAAERIYPRPIADFAARNLLVIGSADEAKPYLQAGHKDGQRLNVVAYVSAEGPRLNGVGNRSDALAGIEQILDRIVVDEVLVAARVPSTYIDRVGASCLQRGLAFSRLIQMPEADFGRSRVARLNSSSYVLSIDTVPQGRWRLAMKRCIDVLGAILGLCMCAAIYLWSGLSIKRQSKGSVIFRQMRVGRNGRNFVVYKFRTMFSDAEARMAELRARNQMRGFMFKIADDPRVIPVGRLLRRRHLDELPQFWNVLAGDMSLVGPRPPTPDEVAHYCTHHRRRLSMKPGITGLWQIQGNHVVSDFEDIVKLDCKYIDSWSLWLDCKILCATIVKVLHATGW